MNKVKGYKNFVRALPGPQSYCKCESLCSPLEVEHVIPKSILKKHSDFRKSQKNAHNLYMCCRKMNRQKGSDLFGRDFILDNEQSYHTGALARACLHMYDTYALQLPPKTVALWRMLDDNHEPYGFEYQRNELIVERWGVPNLYLREDDIIDNFYAPSSLKV